jgi:hypothetical protein
MSIFPTSNVAIGTGTDAGFRLDVSGSTRLNGNTTITGSLTVVSGSAIELQVTNTGVRIGNAITDIHTVTGSLLTSGSFNINAAQYNATSSAASGSSTILITVPTSSYNAVFMDYVAASGSSQRAGNFIGHWLNGSFQFTDTSTLDVGPSTIPVTMSLVLSGANALVRSSTPAGWTIKSTYRLI